MDPAVRKDELPRVKAIWFWPALLPVALLTGYIAYEVLAYWWRFPAAMDSIFLALIVGALSLPWVGLRLSLNWMRRVRRFGLMVAAAYLTELIFLAGPLFGFMTFIYVPHFDDEYMGVSYSGIPWVALFQSFAWAQLILIPGTAYIAGKLSRAGAASVVDTDPAASDRGHWAGR